MTAQEVTSKAISCVLIIGLTALIVFIIVIATSSNSHDADDKTFHSHDYCTPVSVHHRFRDIDGYYGIHGDLGATERPLARFSYDNYDWVHSPDPRTISDLLCDSEHVSSRPTDSFSPVNDLFVTFGQLIDHTLVLVRTDSNYTMDVGHGLSPNKRSKFIVDTEGVQQQINSLTSYLDGSIIYGSSSEVANLLREHHSGRLRSILHDDGPMLPLNENENGFIAGDIRVNEQPLLTALHTLFLREHNYWAHLLSNRLPEADDDYIYHVARHIVIAELQIITYEEWLPILLGDKYKLRKACYRQNLIPGIWNEWATSAYRFGHSMVSDTIHVRSGRTGNVIETYQLSDTFFQSARNSTMWIHGISDLLCGAATHRCEPPDTVIVDSLRNMLFSHAFVNHTLDLAALNIRRGRDHGLPRFQHLYKALGCGHIRSWEDVAPHHSDIQHLLQHLYGSYWDDIEFDPWVGMLCETASNHDSMLGPATSKLICKQFEKIRDTDPYFYLWDQVIDPYKSEIEHIRLKDIVLRNTYIEEINFPHHAFLYPDD